MSSNSFVKMCYSCHVFECDKRYERKDKLIVHILVSHPNSARLECNANVEKNECRQTFVTKYGLKDHIEKYHQNENQSDISEEQSDLIAKNSKTDESEESLELDDYCEKDNDSKQKSLVLNIDDNDSRRLSTRSNYLLRHKRNVRSSDEKIGSDVRDCGQQLKTQKRLKVKKRSNYKKNGFKCEECGKKFVLKNYVIIHKRIHSGEKPFRCDVKDCDKRFRQLSQLNSHKCYVHSNERRFVCRRSNCNQRFKTKQDLNRHNLIHTNVRPYKCDFKNCIQLFKSKRYMIGHKNRVHLKIKFKCLMKNCETICSNVEDIKKHLIAEHTNERHD